MTVSTGRSPWSRPAFLGGVVVLAGLVAFALLTRPDPQQTASGGESVTYEITGASVAEGVQYGDVYSQAYSPYVATRLARTPLPWRLTVPLRGPISLYDLDARSDPPGVPITCTVRRGDTVVVTRTARGIVGCDTQPR